MRTPASCCRRPSMWRPCARRVWMPGLVILVASSVLAGCATTKAATADAGPPLAVPAPPQRVIVPAEEEPLASTSTGLDRPLASVPQVQPPTAPQPRRQTVPRAENDTRNEAASSSATASAAGTIPEPTRDARPVAAAESNSRAQVQTLLNKAAADLKCVDPGKLSNERKAIWNDIKRHADIATDKMKERNYLVAQAAAEKAAAFAADLATTCAR